MNDLQQSTCCMYKKPSEVFLGMRVVVSTRVVEIRLKARAQAFGHPYYQLVTSKVEIFQDDLLIYNVDRYLVQVALTLCGFTLCVSHFVRLPC